MPANIYLLYFFLESAIFNWSTHMFFSMATNCEMYIKFWLEVRKRLFYFLTEEAVFVKNFFYEILVSEYSE